MLPKIFQSSIDASKLSATVTGIIISFSALIIYLLHVIGINIGSEEVSNFATQVGLATGALWTIYGFLRKVIVWTPILWKSLKTGINISEE